MALQHDAPHGAADDQYLNTTEGSGHEHTDANVWLIVQFAIWLIVSALVTHGLMWGMFRWFVESRAAAAPALEFPLARDQAPRLPAGPRLQPIPANEIFEFRQRENAELSELRMGRSQRRHRSHSDRGGDAAAPAARPAVARGGPGISRGRARRRRGGDDAGRFERRPDAWKDAGKTHVNAQGSRLNVQCPTNAAAGCVDLCVEHWALGIGH